MFYSTVFNLGVYQHPIPIPVRRHVEAGQKFLARGNLRYERKSIV